MQNHVFGLFHRLIALNCACRPPAQRVLLSWCRHQPRAYRSFRTAAVAVREAKREDIANLYTNTDSLSFREVVQSWREHGDENSDIAPFSIHSSRIHPTNAAFRHQKRLEVALSGRLTTPTSQLSSAQISIQEFCRSEPYYIDTLPLCDTTLVSDPASSQLKIPSLYQTLLNLIHIHTPLSSLVKFHAAQPLWKRTTRTYNLLISHALLHASFSTVDTLILSLRRDGLKPTRQTEKLTIRLWVRTGRWEWAWSTITAKYGGVKNVPLVLWVEFFGGMKRGALRKHGIVLIEDERVVNARARILFNSAPRLSQEEQAEMPPRTVHAIVKLMLTLGWKKKAQTFTRDYIKALPEQPQDGAILDICRKMVELHLIFPYLPRRATRLSDFYERRKLALDLFPLHDKVSPTPRSLSLLLSLVSHRQRPWSYIQGTINLFRRKWGSAPLDDRYIHRLLAQSALKEGRVAVTRYWIRQAKMLALNNASPSPPRVKRLKHKELHIRRCIEDWRWKKLERRARQASK